ncbi:hypothetical protein BHM03_00017965 [Ensete ventricosum]|nr:hypothetical protein BHM03_00017965 [Ensete ventricosum]
MKHCAHERHCPRQRVHQRPVTGVPCHVRALCNSPEAYLLNLLRVTASAVPVRGETVAKLKVAINGFGRIGRNFLRCWHGRKDSPLEVVVVNDSGGVKNASHLLKYDSMLGTFKADVKAVDNETISVDGKPIKVVSNRDPLKLPWAELGIDIVIEVLLTEFDVKDSPV